LLIRASAFAALVVLGSAASAQTTNCHWVGRTWTCDTAQRTTLDPNIILHAGDALRTLPTYGDVMEQHAAIQARQQAQAEREITYEQEKHDRLEAQQRDQQDYAARQQRESLRQRVGQMVSGGDCAGGQSAALEGGDFDLANQVKTYCSR
jgi:hypothetical protein